MTIAQVLQQEKQIDTDKQNTILAYYTLSHKRCGPMGPNPSK